MSADIIQKLFEIIRARRTADADTSYVASLYLKGLGHIADKVVEEAGELAAEVPGAHRERLKQESADLLFHMLVLWAALDLTPEDIFSVLEQRLGIGGYTEKAARPKNSG